MVNVQVYGVEKEKEILEKLFNIEENQKIIFNNSRMHGKNIAAQHYMEWIKEKEKGIKNKVEQGIKKTKKEKGFIADYEGI